ncbi:MAG: N-acetylneuraminate synthase [Syntrophaceae bacterium]
MTTRVFVIAEAGVNHNGSLAKAKKLVKVAVDAQADAVKFQTFKTQNLVSVKAPKAAYQKEKTDAGESQFKMLKKLELDEKSHRELINCCDELGIQFLSTPFDLESVDLLVGRLNLPRIKISSGEITNAPLLLKVAQSGKPVIISTGMSTLKEIETALGILAFGYSRKKEKYSISNFQKAYSSKAGQSALQEKVVLLHCTTEYPAPFEDANLRAMDTMRSAFGLPVGFSDHTPGIACAIAAVARGAVVIEKHFTLDKNMPGPDHQASLDPQELKDMIKAIRQVELALGSLSKTPTISEGRNMEVIRKSLVAACDIRKGENFSDENLTVKRPANGISPLKYWEYLGKVAKRNYKKDDLIEP